MCQSLLAKVSRSRELLTVAEPELLVLFEEWLEALEEELISLIKAAGSQDPAVLAQQLGISRSGADFLLARLKQDGRI